MSDTENQKPGSAPKETDAAAGERGAESAASAAKPGEAAAPGPAAGETAAAKPAATGGAAADTAAAEKGAAVTPAAGADAAGSAPATPAETAAATKTAAAQPDAAEPDPATGSVFSRPLVLGAAAAVVLIAAIATAITLFLQNREHAALDRAREQAQAAACTYAPVLATYDAKNLDPYFQAVLDGATGDWKDQFADTSTELREVLQQGEVVSRADDVQCAIKTADETSAEAIVVIGQTITSLGTQGQPAPGQLSMVMRLQKDGDRWLVGSMNSPLAPGQQP